MNVGDFYYRLKKPVGVAGVILLVSAGVLFLSIYLVMYFTDPWWDAVLYMGIASLAFIFLLVTGIILATKGYKTKYVEKFGST